jgi:hypothetical protein
MLERSGDNATAQRLGLMFRHHHLQGRQIVHLPFLHDNSSLLSEERLYLRQTGAAIFAGNSQNARKAWGSAIGQGEQNAISANECRNHRLATVSLAASRP